MLLLPVLMTVFVLALPVLSLVWAISESLERDFDKALTATTPKKSISAPSSIEVRAYRPYQWMKTL